MKKNQIFKINPDKDIVIKILNTFGLKCFQDTNYFTKDTMNEINTLDKIIELKDILETYYLPCKVKIYIDDITNKKCITILRQFIKIHGYTLISKERYINHKKLCVYRLIKMDDKPKISPKKKKKDIVISFE